MSAVGLILKARAAGVQLHVDGNVLVLQASTPPRKVLLDRISRYKAAIVLRLRPEANVGSKEYWHALLDERAGMAGSESGLPRDRAVPRGFDHLLPYGGGSPARRRCIRAVGRHGSPSGKTDAVSELAAMGISELAELTDDFEKKEIHDGRYRIGATERDWAQQSGTIPLYRREQTAQSGLP